MWQASAYKKKEKVGDSVCVRMCEREGGREEVMNEEGKYDFLR
jgi:hypothetical protein